MRIFLIKNIYNTRQYFMIILKFIFYWKIFNLASSIGCIRTMYWHVSHSLRWLLHKVYSELLETRPQTHNVIMELNINGYQCVGECACGRVCMSGRWRSLTRLRLARGYYTYVYTTQRQTRTCKLYK